MTSTLSANEKVETKNSIMDEGGNIRLESKNFGISLALTRAGEGQDEATGRRFSWDESIKISVPAKKNEIGTIKLTPLQVAWLLDTFNKNDEVSAELRRRIEAAKKEFAESLGKF